MWISKSKWKDATDRITDLEVRMRIANQKIRCLGGQHDESTTKFIRASEGGPTLWAVRCNYCHKHLRTLQEKPSGVN